ncbi:complex I intermediate-associated protein CIA30 [Coprinopsis sp. MPI-PUGE-AT-0042]|nr:complex I intermediate-associated protein CIA30 [Coprinopsis sp. MPI-PUGE-AT-0042]
MRDNVAKMMLMRGADAPAHEPQTLYTFHNQEDIIQFSTGCDGDIGGRSTVNLALDSRPEVNESIGVKTTGRFWGEMRLDVKPEYQGKIRGGYAGFRNKNRPTFFGNLFDDVSMHEYLALRLRLGGDARLRNSYFVNIQTDGSMSSEVWQHRLFFKRQDGGWEDVFIPFTNFVRTSAGELADTQASMYREKVKGIGISILGGNSGVGGQYELGIESIRAVNESDVTSEPI